MDSQTTKTSTFCAPPLDGSLTIPQLLDYHLEMSPRHKAYIYDDGKGGVVSVEFAQYVRAVYAACQRILGDTESVPHKTGAVVALFADTDTLSYCMLVSAIMRAGLVPFCLSPRNAAVGVANLLQQTTPVAAYISSDLKSVITDALSVLGTPLPVYEAPMFEQLQGALVESLPALPKVEMDSIAYILHTSGSTSIYSKPLYISHKFLLQFGIPPWKDSEDHSGQVLAVHNVPNYHGIGVFVACWPLTSGLTMSVFRPSTPPVRGTPENALKGIIATNPEFVMATPATVETWSESSGGLEMMKSRKALTFLGAPLNKRVGDALVANGVVLCSTYGAMETGLVAPFLEHHGADWDYISIRPDIEVARVPEEDGSSLYTHTYLISSSFTTSYTNSVIDGRPGCSVSDLLEQHPRKSELHRIYGRKDDIIIFSSGLKMSPGSLEAHINRNPLVDAALIFGHTLPHPGVLVQLKPDFQDHLVDDAKRAKVYDTVWTSVEEVNQTSPAHFQIPRKMVLLADPGKPFTLTSKLQPRRRVVFEHYQAEIRAAYLFNQGRRPFNLHRCVGLDQAESNGSSRMRLQCLTLAYVDSKPLQRLEERLVHTPSPSFCAHFVPGMLASAFSLVAGRTMEESNPNDNLKVPLVKASAHWATSLAADRRYKGSPKPEAISPFPLAVMFTARVLMLLASFIRKI